MTQITQTLSDFRAQLFNNKSLVFSLFFKFFALIFGIYINRWLVTSIDTQSLLDYNLVTSYTPIILGFITFGIPILIHKYYTDNSNQNPEYELSNIWTTFLALRIFSFLVGLIIILLTYKLSKVNDLNFVLLTFCGQFLLIADLGYRSVCDALNISYKFTLTDLLNKILIVISLFLAPVLNKMFFGTSLIMYFLTISLTINLLVLFIDFIIHFKYTRITTISFKLIKENIKPIFLLTISAFFFFGSLDKIFLKSFGVDASTIIGYANGYKLFEIGVIIPSLTIPTIASKIKKEFNQNPKDQKIILSKWLRRISIFGILSGLGFYLFSPLVLMIIDPEFKYYQYSLQVIPFFAVCLITSFIGQLFYTLNIFYSKNTLEFILQAIYATGYLILFYFLIPLFGIYGAASAFLIIHLLDLVIRIVMYKNNKLKWL